MAAPQPLPFPRRVPNVTVVPPLLVSAFALLVVGLLAVDAGRTERTSAPVAAAQPAVASAEADTAGAAAPVPVSTYHVRPKDTLSKVAALHGVPMDQVAAANGLAPPYPLTAGQALSIPTRSGPVDLPPGAVSLAAPIGPSIERWAAEYRLDPALLKAMTWRESRWKADALSNRGAIGVGQVLPETAMWVSDNLIAGAARLDPWKVEENLQLSAAYLRWLIDRSGGDEAAALAAYHQGRTSVLQQGWYSVTTRYVTDVLDLRWRFKAAAQG